MKPTLRDIQMGNNEQLSNKITIKKAPTFEEAAEAIKVFCNEELKRQIVIAKRVIKGYPPQTSFSNLKITYHTSKRFYKSRGGRRGGKPFITLSLYKWIQNLMCGESHCTFDEYALIENDRQIGEVNGSIEKCLSALIAHELSHAIQHALKANMSDSSMVFGYNKTQFKKPHGYAWRYIYGLLRKYAVNEAK
ncbi:hypothetical protein OTK49_21380 [Vibrio coralliirubri]|uniref:hypothetical protein n=1 Tax=Vibrio coralliirubri TaxID=1516159 RepID=UPI002284AC17|nr:hypothetical protein [Vibrio coralliirubri]MCY9865074.1 hypothetical protein [Vibrio coralliirubri]